MINSLFRDWSDTGNVGNMVMFVLCQNQTKFFFLKNFNNGGNIGNIVILTTLSSEFETVQVMLVI